MMSQFQDLIAFFEDSSVADAIRENDLLFPSIESIHVVAICLVVGSILVLDMRLLGFASLNLSRTGLGDRCQLRRRLHDFSDPEIQQFGYPIGSNQDIAGLQIPVND